ncbi:PLP-dependent aminotransferase family protein [Kitasatospora aureofaciens]|uniref:aminotransferase-like domain-containing protein n=1 Tax=Kitasatospora aureofaciens TaxID=1894 RepID=UPI0033E2786C
MNFLNEVANRYPDAVPFAAGRPFETFFAVEDVHRHLQRFSEYLEYDCGLTPEQVRRVICQYGRTKGIVHQLVARNLAIDEGIEVDPESILVTVGCQEAMFLVLRALRADDRDVVLAVRPTYVGLEGAAQLVNMQVLPVADAPGGIDLNDLTIQMHEARKAGLRPRALYVIPDFANPSGNSMDLTTRRRLLEIATQEDLLLLEDNPYGLFHGDRERLPTLKALDQSRRVVYLGSFAKTVMPGTRVGYVVADQRVADRTGSVELLADQLSKIKSMLTVNTSPIAQAVIGGKLLEDGNSLIRSNAAAKALYAANLKQIADGLAQRVPPGRGVAWNSPTGGFFLVVTVPFPADDAALEMSAQRYGVLWTPMHHFYGGKGGEYQLRLSASAVTPEEIESGLDRLVAFVSDQIAGN